jgi:predicted nucleotidyltransferase
MDQALQSDLEIIKDSILKQVDDVRAIYLFGSVARGTERKESDYDILIFVRKSPKNKVRTIANIRIDVEDRIQRRLESFLMEVEDISYPSPILYEVYHNNRLVYGENVLARASEIVRKIRPHVKDGRVVDYHVEH